MADSVNIVVNATAKPPKRGVWVHFGFPGSPDGTILTKKVLQLCSFFEFLHTIIY